jgi:hypothetical protein
MRIRRELAAALLAGAVTGLLGVVLFGVVHAALIMSIWTRLGGGIPFGIAAGLAMGWAFSEMHGVWCREHRRIRGLWFGGLLWVTLIPTTACGVLFRSTGWHGRHDVLETVTEVAVAFGTVAMTGRLIGRGWQRPAAFGTATALLAVAMGGPIAVTTGVRPLRLFLAFAVIYAVGGIG